MPTERSDLQIVIEAVNKASKDLRQVEKDLKSLSEGAKTAGSSTQKMGAESVVASVGFKQMAAAVAVGAGAAYVAKEAFNFAAGAVRDLVGAMKDATVYASRVNELAIAMQVVAANAGIASEDVTELRDSVKDQNITTEAANTLMTRLIQNQLDYTKATELASAAQNLAVVSGGSSSETLERITQAISSGYPFLLKQLGLTKHQNEIYDEYAATLGKAGNQLSETGRKQAVMNYVIKESAKYTGLYDLAMTNAYKKMGSLKDKIKEAAFELGQTLEPALKGIVDEAYKAVVAVIDWASQNQDKLRAIAKAVGDWVLTTIQSIKNFISMNKDLFVAIANTVGVVVTKFIANLKMVLGAIQLVANGIQAAVSFIVRASQVASRAVKGDWDGVGKASKGLVKDWAKTQKAMEGNWNQIISGAKQSSNAYKFNLQNFWNEVKGIEGTALDIRIQQQLEANAKLTAAEMERLDKLREENEKYAKDVAKRQKAFNEQLEDMIIAHRDTWKSLKDDIQGEKVEFEKSLKEKELANEKSLAKMAKDHKKKTESILEDMEKEKRAAQEEIDDINKEWNELIELTKGAGEDRLANLQAQLDKEVALGSKADNEKIAALQEMIKKERAELEKAVDKQEDERDEEVKDVEDALNEKLAELQGELDAETQAYKESVDEKKILYDKDVANAVEAHNKKLTELQVELDAEEELRKRYAEDFARVGDRVAEDDITRLKRQHMEEMAEMEDAHQQKVAEISSTGYDMGFAEGESFKQGFDQSGVVEWVQSRYDAMEEARQRQLGIEPFAFGGSGKSGGGASGGWQHGGVVSQPSIVGEKGYPEVVLPLGEPGRIAQILKSVGIGGEKGQAIEQHFHIVVQKESDIDAIMERAAFNMKYRL